LDDGEELIQESIDLGLVEEINSVTEVLLLEVLEISLIMELFVLSLSDFLDFVVVDVELLSIEGLLVEFILGLLSFLWVLEADEGIDSLAFLGEELDVLDFSVLREEFFELLFSGSRREVLDIEIASLLGVLVSKHLLGLFHFSLGLLEGFLDVKFLTVNDLSVEFHDSFHGSFGSSFSVFVVLVSIADEGEGSFLILDHVNAKNVTVLSEEFLEIIFSPGGGEVLDIDVVESFSHVSSILGSIGLDIES
jgi:hypothetical protein